MRLQQVGGTVAKALAGLISVPASVNALYFNLEGTLLARSNSGKLIVAPPKSLLFVRGGARLMTLVARGEHDGLLVAWQTGTAPVLDEWLGGSGDSGPARMVACKPIAPMFTAAYERLEAARKGPFEAMDPLILAASMEMVVRLLVGGDELQLAAIPVDLPETIRELTVLVREKPSAPWPLKDAADQAGYSPFHFSRVFKQLVGYGFHEFVDRCRTEAAVEMLCNSDKAVDLVASTCGFGTTQGLRESVKEYLGLVPSELRVLPEAVQPPIG